MSRHTEDPNWRYDQTAYNKIGYAQNSKRCVESVSTAGGWHFPQCSRNRGHGRKRLYCKQHAKRNPAEVNDE